MDCIKTVALGHETRESIPIEFWRHAIANRKVKPEFFNRINAVIEWPPICRLIGSSYGIGLPDRPFVL